jgi:predicted acylesterase/phospholipase RssA
MHEREIESHELPPIIQFLSSLDLFKKLDQTALDDLAKSLTLLSIGGGQTLIQQGQTDASLYILFQGRLRVYIDAKEVADIALGQMVGEISLLTSQPRTASVKAIRDSTILKFSKEAFEKFKQKDREAVIDMAQMAIKRLISKPKPTQAGENIITICVGPAGTSNHIPFLRKLVDHLDKIKPTLFMTKERLNAHFGQEVAEAPIHHKDNLKINEWLNSLEEKWGYIVYEMESDLSPWTERCIRQADRLILVAEESISTELNEIEKQLFSQREESGIPSPYLDIVFLHPEKKASGTSLWLEKRPLDNYHHLRLNSEEDFGRLIRFLTGKAFGVVLNGGGIRGFSHAGVMKAFEELKIPIDFIGGSSAGAMVSAMYTVFGAEKTIEICLSKEVAKGSSDFTFPLISLLRGKNASDLYHKYGEEIMIEDTWTRFFCVSTNVSEGKLEIHQRGLIWKAVRASTSLPGIFPPLFNEKGDMLVDGSVLDNMPVGVMRKLLGGGKIFAVNCHMDIAPFPKLMFQETWFSGWKLLFQKWNPFRKKELQYPSILDILRTSLSIAAEELQKKMEKEADYLLKLDTSAYALLDYENREKIIALGYQKAKEELPTLFSKPPKI